MMVRLLVPVGLGHGLAHSRIWFSVMSTPCTASSSSCSRCPSLGF